jgi:branched-chain amino acid transport system permease protein
VLLKHEVSHYTVYWHMVVGAVLILAVLAGGRGLFGEFEYRLDRWRERRRLRRRTVDA